MKVRIAAVHDHIVGTEEAAESGDRRFGGRSGRHHHPDGARRRQRGDERLETGGAAGTGGFGAAHRLVRPVERHDLVTASDEARDHVETHPAESDEPELHHGS